MRRDWIGIVVVSVLVCMAILPRSGLADYIANKYMAAVLRAYPDTFLVEGQRFGTEPIDSTTISITLGDGTKTIFLTSNAMTSVVYAYEGGAALDTVRVKAGTYYTLYVHGRDSLRVERPYPTMFAWVKNPSYEGVAGGYMNQFSKACPYAHGDTMASGETTMSYSTRAANLDADHFGYANNFQCFMVSGVGNASARLFVQAWYKDHLIAQFLVPANRPFQSEAWTFDSLKVTEQGNFTASSYSVSWNHGTY